MSTSTLNPSAPEYVPSTSMLNPSAPKYIPHPPSGVEWKNPENTNFGNVHTTSSCRNISSSQDS